MKACVLHKPGVICLETISKPEPGQREVLIRVGACGVCGSDIPRIFEKGAHIMPLIPGHEFAGTVEAVGNETDNALLGKRVAVFPLIPCGECDACEIGAYAQCRSYNYLGSRCDGAFAEYVVAPAANCILLPDGVSMESGAMAEPAAVAAHAVRRSSIKAGDAVAVFGAGPIGLLVAQWARIHGALSVWLVDIDDRKFETAEMLGFTDFCNPRMSDTVEVIRSATGRGVDVAIEATGASAALEQLVQCVCPFGSVSLLGNPAGTMSLSQNAYWHVLRNELHLNGCWNSVFAELPRNEWELALNCMASGLLQTTPLISHRCSLETLPQHLQSMHENAFPFSKVMLANQ